MPRDGLPKDIEMLDDDEGEQLPEAEDKPKAEPQEGIEKRVDAILQEKLKELSLTESRKWQSVSDKQIAEARRQAQREVAAAQAEAKLYQDFLETKAKGDEQLEFELWKFRKGRAVASPEPVAQPSQSVEAFTQGVLGNRLDVLKEAELEAKDMPGWDAIDLTSQNGFMESEKVFQKGVARALKQQAENKERKAAETAQRKWKEAGGPKTDTGGPAGASKKVWTVAEIAQMQQTPEGLAEYKKNERAILQAMYEGRVKE